MHSCQTRRVLCIDIVLTDYSNYLLVTGASPDTIRAALRTFYRWAVDFGIVSLNPSVN